MTVHIRMIRLRLTSVNKAWQASHDGELSSGVQSFGSGALGGILNTLPVEVAHIAEADVIGLTLSMLCLAVAEELEWLASGDKATRLAAAPPPPTASK